MSARRDTSTNEAATGDDGSVEVKIEEMRRSLRRFRLLAGGVTAALMAFTVAPVAANHLNVKTSDINNGAVTTPKLRDNAVTTPKINNGAVKAAKIDNGAVGTGKLQNGAVTGAKISDGAVGPNKLGQHAIPVRAYARVGLDGTVAQGTGRNITSANITHAATGIYCFHGLPFTPRVPMVNAYGTPGDNFATVAHQAPGFHPPCPQGTQYTIIFRRGDTGAPRNELFAVTFLGDGPRGFAAHAEADIDVEGRE